MIHRVHAWAILLLAAVLSGLLFAAHSSGTRNAHGLIELYSYAGKSNWSHFEPADNLMKLQDSALLSTQQAIQIDRTHRLGLLHRGLWLAVTRVAAEGQKQVLMLKRGPQLVTCPGAWGFVGEHLEPAESWSAAAQRAAKEELSLKIPESQGINMIPGGSVLVRIPYAGHSDRKDLQACGLFMLPLDEQQIAHIKPDDEVAEMRWMSHHELGQMIERKEGLCNPEIVELAALFYNLLRQKGNL